MVMLVRLFGILIVFIGFLFLINTQSFKQYILFWKQGKRLQIGGVVAILFGALFLAAAPQCRIVWVITILGIWSVIKGILLFVLNQKKLYSYIDWWQGTSALVTRILAVIAIVFGALLIYSA